MKENIEGQKRIQSDIQLPCGEHALQVCMYIYYVMHMEAQASLSERKRQKHAAQAMQSMPKTLSFKVV